MNIDNIPYNPEIKKPVGCRNDSTGQLLDTTDTDHDGFPDCMDWEINSPPKSIVDSIGVTVDFDLQDFIDQADNYYDPEKFGVDSTEESKSFNLKDALKVSNKSSQSPVDKEHSLFLSLSGTLDNEKGLEITDVSGMKHGAFTAALIQLYRNNLPTLPLYELINQVPVIMQQQFYRQSPAFHYDPARMNGNLVGVSPSGFSDRLKAVCLSNKKGIITIDKGLFAGVTKGNIFLLLRRRGNKRSRS